MRMTLYWLWIVTRKYRSRPVQSGTIMGSQARRVSHEVAETASGLHQAREAGG